MLALAISFLNSITDIIVMYFIKKSLISIQNQKLQKNYFSNFENYKLYINKTFIMNKNFKNKFIIKKSSPKLCFK